MELLWLFGMSTKAYAWFVVIVSFLLCIPLCACGGMSEDEYCDLFGFPKPPLELPEDLNIEIIIDKPEEDHEEDNQDQPEDKISTFGEGDNQ